ncbi:MAG: MiaB/RimO family radical SAM methylthiotransferase [Candidatus Omnitrophica bacterium]|nr:MiaB/RimO family radical SAM methylthiotransferase [Candidatus Omnitrophota bacterium]
MTHSHSSSKNVRFYTLGYRDIEGQKGLPCDLVIVNTCTVTHDSDRTNRYWIRRLRREHPQAQLAVTGCYAEKNRAELEAMPEVDLIFLNEEKPFLAEKLLGPADVGAIARAYDPATFSPLSISRSEGKTRAYVKVQDGCDHACSFCKVSIVRGPSRSRELSEILEEVKRLRDGGYREIILTGIQLGAYGRDLDSRSNPGERAYLLRDTIETVARVEGIERIRLSSIELMDLSRPLREAFRSVPKLCPHIHLPLQSGDNEVLARMNRRYAREDYRDVVLELKNHVPDFEFSVDVMAGFPGETEAQFANTFELLEILKPLKTHVFPYSRREGTRAADWEMLPAGVFRDRVRRLMRLAEKTPAPFLAR